MSEAPTPKWSSDGFRVIFDPTPGGVPQEGGGRSYSLCIPALEVTEWVENRDVVAAEIAKALNDDDAKDAEIKRLQGLVTSSEQERYRAVGALVAKDAEIARLREALKASRDVHAGLAEYILQAKDSTDTRGMFADLQRARLAVDAALAEGAPHA